MDTKQCCVATACGSFFSCIFLGNLKFHKKYPTFSFSACQLLVHFFRQIPLNISVELEKLKSQDHAPKFIIFDMIVGNN